MTCIAERMSKDAGYKTYFVGKWDAGSTVMEQVQTLSISLKFLCSPIANKVKLYRLHSEEDIVNHLDISTI